jgi:hypothetical protein
VAGDRNLQDGDETVSQARPRNEPPKDHERDQDCRFPDEGENSMSVATAKVSDGLYTFLTADSTFNTQIGGDASTAGRLRQGFAEENVTFPYAVMSSVSGIPEDTFTKDGMRILIQFDLYEKEAAGMRSAMDLLDTLMARLHRKTFAITGHKFMASLLQNYIGPFKEDKAIRIVATFALEGDAN